MLNIKVWNIQRGDGMNQNKLKSLNKHVFANNGFGDVEDLFFQTNIQNFCSGGRYLQLLWGYLD